MRKGEFVRVIISYPKNKKLNGLFEGKVIEVGCFRNGYAFFKLDSCPKLALPNSSKYLKILERRF